MNTKEMAFQPSFGMAATSHQDSHPSVMMSPWMQVPSTIMPWCVDTRPDLIRFGETTSETNAWGIPRPKLRCSKRKPDLDINPRPIKMYISEERMAAQLKNMHISNTYTGQEWFGDLSGESFLPSLVLSKEVQNLPTFMQENLLPQCLLQKIERPNRALVLWKPPAGSLSTQMISSMQSDPEEEANSNNNSSTPDLNSMISGFTSSSTEMEL